MAPNVSTARSTTTSGSSPSLIYLPELVFPTTARGPPITPTERHGVRRNYVGTRYRSDLEDLPFREVRSRIETRDTRGEDRRGSSRHSPNLSYTYGIECATLPDDTTRIPVLADPTTPSISRRNISAADLTRNGLLASVNAAVNIEAERNNSVDTARYSRQQIHHGTQTNVQYAHPILPRLQRLLRSRDYGDVRNNDEPSSDMRLIARRIDVARHNRGAKGEVSTSTSSTSNSANDSTDNGFSPRRPSPIPAVREEKASSIRSGEQIDLAAADPPAPATAERKHSLKRSSSTEFLIVDNDCTSIHGGTLVVRRDVSWTSKAPRQTEPPVVEEQRVAEVTESATSSTSGNAAAAVSTSEHISTNESAASMTAVMSNQNEGCVSSTGLPIERPVSVSGMASPGTTGGVSKTTTGLPSVDLRESRPGREGIRPSASTTSTSSRDVPDIPTITVGLERRDALNIPNIALGADTREMPNFNTYGLLEGPPISNLARAAGHGSQFNELFAYTTNQRWIYPGSYEQSLNTIDGRPNPPFLQAGTRIFLNSIDGAAPPIPIQRRAVFVDAVLTHFTSENAEESGGLPESIVDLLPTEEYQTEGRAGKQATACAICTVEYQENDTLRRLPCWHNFHQQCIDSWLSRKATCPLCRIRADMLTASTPL